jgi:hypothetical protein
MLRQLVHLRYVKRLILQLFRIFLWPLRIIKVRRYCNNCWDERSAHCGWRRPFAAAVRHRACGLPRRMRAAAMRLQQDGICLIFLLPACFFSAAPAAAALFLRPRLPGEEPVLYITSSSP